jgi:hypothetical protein
MKSSLKPHRTDALSLTFGVIFLGAVVIWILNKVASSQLPGMGWVVAGGLIVAGVIGLTSALRSDRAKDADAADEPAPTAHDEFATDPFGTGPTPNDFTPNDFTSNDFTSKP